MSRSLVVTLLLGVGLFAALFPVYLMAIGFQYGNEKNAFVRLLPGVIGYSFLFSILLKRYFRKEGNDSKSFTFKRKTSNKF